MAQLGESSSMHTIQDEEKRSFVGYINSTLKDDPDLQGTLPLNPSNDSLYSSVGSGVLLGKLINALAPGTVDLSKFKIKNIYKFNQLENLNTVLDAAKRIGCNIVNISAEDIIARKPHLVCGLIWQILKNGLEIKMSSAMHAQRSSANDYQDVVLEWLNTNLRAAGCERVVKNFSSDLADSIPLIYICNRMYPDACSLEPLKIADPKARAEALIEQLEKADVRRLITVNSITHGISKLNFAFLAELVAMKPGEVRLQRSTMRESRVMPGGILASAATTTRLKEAQTEPKLAMSDTEALRRHTTHAAVLQSPSTSAQTEKMRSLEEELNTQTAKVRDAGSQLQHLRDEVAKLHKENAALQQRCAALEESSKRNELAAAAAKATQPAPAPMAPPADSKEQVVELTSELEKAKVTIAELEARVSERANLLSTLDTLESRFDEVSKEKEQLSQRVRELEKERSRSKKKGSREGTNLEGKPKEKHAAFSKSGSATGATTVDVLAARNAELEQKLKAYQTEELLRMRTDTQYIKFPVKEFKSNCKRSGFLTKLSKNGKKWKKRFFILKDNYLFYWKSNKDSDKHAKFVRLNGCTVEAHPEKKTAFSVLCHGRRITVQAEDEKAMGEWMGAVQETIRVLPVPTEEVSPAARRQRYSTLQRIKQGFLSKNDTKKKMAEEEMHAKSTGVPKTESSPAAITVTPAAAKPAAVALESSDSSSSSE